MIRITEDRRKVGGVALGAIYVGDEPDEQHGDLTAHDIGAILNVAQDMVSSRGWLHGLEVAHVGLIDGPGNELCMYTSAVLALHSLLKRHNVLVCCHGGGRSLAVAVMYLRVIGGRDWDWWMCVLGERTDHELDLLAMPNNVHRNAFDKMDWVSLKMLMEVK